MMNDIRMILLRPFTILLRAPEAIPTSDDALTGDARKLRHVVGIWAGDDRIEPAEVDGDQRVRCGEVSWLDVSVEYPETKIHGHTRHEAVGLQS